MIKKQKKYFISYITGYFEAMYSWAPYQNFYLYPVKQAKELGYTCIVIVKDGTDILKSDPQYSADIEIYDYKNFFHFTLLVIFFSIKNSVFYVNNHTKQSYISIILAKVFGAKTIFMGHIQPLRTSKVRQYIFDIILFFSDRVRLSNESEKDYLVKRRVSKRKLYVVPMALNTKDFFVKESDYTKRSDVVYYGNMTKQKGLPTIFKAVSLLKDKYPNVKLHVVGSQGDYYPDQDVQRLGLDGRVIFYGAQKHGDVLNSLLNERLVFVLSSKGEGQCLAVFESALSGNALCLPNIMSFSGVFKDCARFHEVGDAKKLSEDIEYYLTHVKEVENDVNKAIELIKKDYSERVVESKLEGLLSF